MGNNRCAHVFYRRMDSILESMHTESRYFAAFMILGFSRCPLSIKMKPFIFINFFKRSGLNVIYPEIVGLLNVAFKRTHHHKSFLRILVSKIFFTIVGTATTSIRAYRTLLYLLKTWIDLEISAENEKIAEYLFR